MARDYELGELLETLGKAVRDRDYDNHCKATGQMRAVVVKMLTSLPKIVDVLAEGVPQSALDYVDEAELAIERGDIRYVKYCLDKLRAIGKRDAQQPEPIAPVRGVD